MILVLKVKTLLQWEGSKIPTAQISIFSAQSEERNGNVRGTYICNTCILRTDICKSVFCA
jgi:hypothetical protein